MRLWEKFWDFALDLLLPFSNFGRLSSQAEPVGAWRRERERERERERIGGWLGQAVDNGRIFRMGYIRYANATAIFFLWILFILCLFTRCYILP